ncbi:MAG TPA: HAD hydrolase-like protein, partial [Burkholderiaceae bacterium]|nr:HAD hydrolase-like protein [Burkholderiaceae bacterium]
MNSQTLERFDLVVFDWDGTLINSTATIARSIQQAAADLGLRVPDFEAASHVIGLGLQDALARAVPDLRPDRA